MHRNEVELDRLDDEELIAHVSEARNAGDAKSVRAAVDMLVFRHFDNVLGRVYLKVDRNDAEDVAMNAITSALASSFSGEHIGQFRSWLNTITDRRVADHHEAAGRRPATETLAVEAGGDDQGPGRQLASTEEEIGAVATRDIVDRVLADSSERHRMVFNLFLDGNGAARIADLVNETGRWPESRMTEANVHQITKRIRDRIKADLDDAGDGG